MKSILYQLIGWICMGSYFSCRPDFSKESTPTIGEVVIGCDIQFKELAQQEEEIFEQQYKYAKVHIKYYSESELFKYWLLDSFKTIICSRSLNSDEIHFFKVNRKVTPRHFPFAIGALALVSSTNSKDTAMTFESLIELCGRPQTKQGGFNQLILEDTKSGISHYMLDLSKDTIFKGSVYALDNKETLFNHLRQHPNALAVLDWTAFSDSDNKQKKQELKDLQIIKISRPRDSTQMGFLAPDQYLLRDGIYPLQRTWQFISISGKSDLALGFASFVAGEIGQRILLKAGLLPLFQTERWIEFKEGDYRVVQ